MAEEQSKFADISSLKSSTGVSKLFADLIEAKVLKKDEELTDKPESIINLINSYIGDIAANSFFEQRMYLNETNESTAVLSETLLSKLLDNEISNIYAHPASGLFFLAFPKKALLEVALPDEKNSTTVKKVRINKESRFAFLSGQSFVLDHSIDIYITAWDTDKPIFKANFDLSDKYDSGLSAISNSVINVRPINYAGVEYIAIDVPARNYEREYYNIIINSSDIAEETYKFSNHLMGFEVLYKENLNSDWRKLTGYPADREAVNGYHFDIQEKMGEKYLKIYFGNNTNSFKPAIRSELQVIVYTTLGVDGNMKIPNIDANLDNLQFYLQQETSNVYESAISTVIMLASSKSLETTGGRNQMSFEELKSYVINKKSSNKILSMADLERKVKEYSGCDTEKVRHDLDMDIRINSTLTDKTTAENISSGFGTFRFDLLDIPERVEIKSRIIKPTDVFRLDETDKIYKYQKTPTSYAKYVEMYKANEYTEASFPFFIKFMSSSELATNVYDLACNDIYYLSSNFYDNIALDNVTISNVKVYRNPSTEFPSQENIEREIEGFYFIEFTAIVGDSLISTIKDEHTRMLNQEDILPTVNFRLSFIDKNTKRTYCADAEIIEIVEEEKKLLLRTTLKTNNNVRSDGHICFTDYSLVPAPVPAVPTRYYYLDNVVNMEISVIFRSPEMSINRDVTYDKIMTKSEIEEGYYVGISYITEDVCFGKDLTDAFKFITDIKIKPPIYKRYLKDEFERYTSDVFEYDEQGNPVFKDVSVTLADGTKVETKMISILHQKGDYVLDDQGNKKPKHKAGDIIYDEYGKPTRTNDASDMYGFIKNFPWYDRIYNVNTKYFDIRDSYYAKINILTELQSIVLNGINLSMGLKRTSGRSSLFFIKNLLTGQLENLDNIAISLEFGVKFEDNMTETDIQFNISKIIEKTKEYIYNEVKEELNVNNLFSYLKDNIPSIIRLEHYKLNNYDANKTQTIIKKTTTSSVENEILGIRTRIDEDTSDISKNEVYFKPDIVVKLI